MSDMSKRPPGWTPSDPPTFRMEPVPGRPGVVRPVLSKPIRVDPETGAIDWDDDPPEWEAVTVRGE